MGGLFSSPKISSPAPAPVAPTTSNSADALAKAAQEDAIRRQAAGRSSTVLTGAQGLGSTGNVSSTAGLLGGS